MPGVNFTVSPEPGLSPGLHTATVTVNTTPQALEAQVHPSDAPYFTVTVNVAPPFVPPVVTPTPPPQADAPTGRGGHGTGGGTAAQRFRIPVTGTGITVEGTRSGTGGTIIAITLPTATVNDIIRRLTGDVVIFDFTGMARITGASIPRDALARFASEGLGVKFALPTGTILLDASAAASVSEQAPGSRITFSIDPIEAHNLTAAQRAVVSPGQSLFRVTATSSGRVISNIDGSITVTVDYDGPTPVSVWFLNEVGIPTLLQSSFDEASGTVTFTTSQLGEFVIGTGDIGARAPAPAPAAADPLPVTPIAVRTVTELRLEIGSTTFTRNGMPSASDAAPFIDPVHSRTMVPLALIGEALGAQVTWEEATRTVLIVRDGITLTIQVDSPLPDGMGMPEIVGGRTFVPIAYVANQLGANVRWDGVARAVYIQQ